MLSGCYPRSLGPNDPHRSQAVIERWCEICDMLAEDSFDRCREIGELDPGMVKNIARRGDVAELFFEDVTDEFLCIAFRFLIRYIKLKL